MRSWFEMKKAADANAAEILIYGEIGKSFWDDDAVGPKEFVDDLAALGDVSNILLRVNSPGGDVFAGIAIFNSLKNHKATVTAQVDGIAASAASYIVMAADTIRMPSNSFLLVHGASGFAYGTADTVRALADDLDRIDKSIVATYAGRANITIAKVQALMREDRLLPADEAKSLGFADEVTEPIKMVANFSLRLLPKSAAARLQAVAGDPAEAAEMSEVSSPTLPASPTKEEPEPESDEAKAATAEVINIKTAKQTGATEHKAYVDSITDLCTLARAPERVGGYVRAGTPADQVRKELLALRAAESPILAQHPLVETQKTTAAAWSAITDKLNARFNARKGA